MGRKNPQESGHASGVLQRTVCTEDDTSSSPLFGLDKVGLKAQEKKKWGGGGGSCSEDGILARTCEQPLVSWLNSLLQRSGCWKSSVLSFFPHLRITLLITAVTDLPLLNPPGCEAIRTDGKKQPSDNAIKI